MKIEEQVVSLKLAKQLKELGVKQDSIYFWVDINDDDKPEAILFNNDELLSNEGANCYSAFTVAELGEMLPSIDVFTFKNSEQNGYLCLYKPFMVDTKMKAWHAEFGEIEADARAKMLIYCIENELIKIK